MKTTYLIYKQINGTPQLVKATQEEWTAILKANEKLTPEQRRRFEMDCIEENGKMDRMYIEVNERDYRVWQTTNQKKYRNRKDGSLFETLSLDAKIESAEVSTLHDCVASPAKTDQPLFDKALLPDLEKALSMLETLGSRAASSLHEGQTTLQHVMACQLLRSIRADGASLQEGIRAFCKKIF